MDRLTGLLVLTAVMGLALAAPAAAQEESPLEGAWMVERANPPDEEAYDPRPGLVLFTDTHYSETGVTGEGPRADLPDLEEGEEPNQKQKLATYEVWERFIANAGRYEVEGDSVTIRPFVAKNPDVMSGFPDNAATFEFRVEGDTLEIYYGEGGVTTLRRVEDMEPPY